MRGSVNMRRYGASAVAVASILLATACSAGEGRRSSTPESTQPSPTQAAERECSRTPDDAPLQLALGVQPAGTGVGGQVMAPGRVRQLVRMAKDAGADIISTTADWAAIEPRPGQTDFAPLDSVLDSARAAGLQTQIVIRKQPVWAQDTPQPQRWRPPLTDVDLEGWRGYLEALMRHTKGRVDYVEVWPDSNAARYWRTGPDPQAFARLLETSYRAIKRVAPEVQVISGGISGNSVGYLDQVLAARDTIFGRQTRIFDQVGVNPTASALAPTERADVGRDAFGLRTDDLAGYTLMSRELDRSGEADTPLFVTRFGYRTSGYGAVTDEMRAGYAAETLDLLQCDARVNAIGWYYLHPTPWDPAPWTVLDRSFRQSETYRALAEWTP